MARGSRLHLLLWSETAVCILRVAYSLCIWLILIAWNDTHCAFGSLLLFIECRCWRIPLIVKSGSAFYRTWIICMVVVYLLFFVVIVVQRSKFLVFFVDFDWRSALISIDIMSIVCRLAQSFSLVLTREGWFCLNLLSAIVSWLFVGFNIHKVDQPLVSVSHFNAVWGFKLIYLGWCKVWSYRSSNRTLLFVSFQNALCWWVRNRFLLLGIKAHILLLSSRDRRLSLMFVFLITVLLGIWSRLLNVKLLAVLIFIKLDSFIWSFRLRRIWCVEAFFSGSSRVLSSILLVFTQRHTLLIHLVGFRGFFSFQSERILSFILHKWWSIFFVVSKILRKTRSNLVCWISCWLVSLFKLIIIYPLIIVFLFRSVFINNIFSSAVSLRLQSLFLFRIIVILVSVHFKLLI